MATQAVAPPKRDFSWAVSESRPLSLIALALGTAGLLVFFVGTLIVLWLNGFTPVKSLVLGFRSNEITGVAITSIALGVAAMALGWGTYRGMPTKVSREQSISGAVLGLQVALGGGVLLWFNEAADVELFVSLYLDLEVLGPQIDAFINGAKNTLILALAGEFFGIILGLILAVFAISKRAVVRAPARAYINFFRATPLLWQLTIIGIAIPIGMGVNIDTYRAGIIAFSLNTGAYAAEVFRAGIQSIERGQIEAARGLGMSYMQAMRYAVIPQAVRRVIPPLMNEFVILVKDTSLIIFLGLTAGQRDLMSVGNQFLANTFNATYMLATVLGYLAICLPSIRLVNILERKLRSGLVGVTGH